LALFLRNLVFGEYFGNDFRQSLSGHSRRCAAVTLGFDLKQQRDACVYPFNVRAMFCK